jgi:hypothetical protein
MLKRLDSGFRRNDGICVLDLCSEFLTQHTSVNVDIFIIEDRQLENQIKQRLVYVKVLSWEEFVKYVEGL